MDLGQKVWGFPLPKESVSSCPVVSPLVLWPLQNVSCSLKPLQGFFLFIILKMTEDVLGMK